MIEIGGLWWIAALLGAVIVCRIFLHIKYKRLARESALSPHIAPITVKGGIGETLGASQVGLLLQAELATVSSLVRRPRGTRFPIPSAAPLPRNLVDMMGMVTANIQIALDQEPVQFQVEEDFTIKAAGIEIPVGKLWKLIPALATLGLRSRRRYLDSRISISFTSTSNDETQLVAHSGGRVLTTSAPTA
ncbi:MAG: hypothetical protein GY953_24155, partial [bacterium]|nr:hypothetical protein [bacterium]